MKSKHLLKQVYERTEPVREEFVEGQPIPGRMAHFRILTIPSHAEATEYRDERGVPEGKELVHACPACHETLCYRFPYLEGALHISRRDLERFYDMDRIAHREARQALRREVEYQEGRRFTVERYLDAAEEWAG